MDISMDQLPCHINLGASCCGIFNKVKNGNLICNECGDVFYSIENKAPDVDELVWVWDTDYADCSPEKDKRINSPEVNWGTHYSITHWKPVNEKGDTDE